MNTEIIVSVLIAFLLWDFAEYLTRKLAMRRLQKKLEKTLNKNKN